MSDTDRWVVMMLVSVGQSTAEGNGLGVTLVYVAVGLVLLALFGPLAYLIGRDANSRGRNGLAWGLLFLGQPIIVGIVYLIIRRKGPRAEIRPDQPLAS